MHRLTSLGENAFLPREKVLSTHALKGTGVVLTNSTNSHHLMVSERLRSHSFFKWLVEGNPVQALIQILCFRSN